MNAAGSLTMFTTNLAGAGRPGTGASTMISLDAFVESATLLGIERKERLADLG